MKKLLLLTLIAVLFAACEKTDPIADLEGDLVLKKAVWKMDAELDLQNGQHFELNLLGKKNDWNDKPVENPARHTMFIPRDTEGWLIDLQKPNNLGYDELPGVRIDMSQGDEFAVLDGTVYDGDGCEFQLGKGKYAVYVALRGKKNVDPADIASWLEALQETFDVALETTDSLWMYQKLGEVSVKRNWTNITDLFTIDETEAGLLPWDDGGSDVMWIFDYMEWLGDQVIEVDVDGDGVIDEVTSYSELANFWQLQNNGSQLIKVRFYPLP